MDFMREFVLPFCGFIVAILFGIIGVGAAFGYLDCNGFGAATGLATRWNFSGCYAKVDNQWVPKQYVFGNAEELRIKAKP